MLSPWVWLADIGPLCLVIAVFMTPRARVAAVALTAAQANLALAVGATAAVAWFGGPLRTPTLGAGGLGLAAYLDALSATMNVLVSFIGCIVVAYSRNYLEGEARHAAFVRRLCFTIAAVLFMILAGNAVQLLIALIATSIGLNGLLVFYGDRPAAALCARKKFIASRIGDVALAGALVLLYRTFGSLDYAALFSGAAAAAGGAVAPAVHMASVLLVVTALLSSAQFPMHGWLTEVMETPTPVSALLHAGIINAGGFLVLRFSGIVSFSTAAMELLVIVGGFTAIFGSVVMLTQTSVKVSLAFSTIAQMGFMMLECGLAAFPAALLHIVAHSLYKAHAFLSSGSVIDIARAAWVPAAGTRSHPQRYALALAASLAIALVAAAAFGVTPAEQPGTVALGIVLVLALVHLTATAIDGRPQLYVVARTALVAGGVSIAYFGLQALMERVFDASLPVAAPAKGALVGISSACVVAVFAVVTFFQGLIPDDDPTPLWQHAHAFFVNGGYVNTWFNALLLRYWPPQAARATTDVAR